MRRLTGLLPAFLVALIALFAPTAAHAHTDFDSSNPADGETVEGPLADVVLTFTQPVSPIEGGIVVAGSDGSTTIAAVSADGPRLVATFDPPLGDGTYTMAWQARSSDTHVIDGAFSFTVTVAPPPTTAAPVATDPPPTSLVEPSAGATTTAPGSTIPPTTPAADAPTTDAPTTTAADVSTAAAAPPPVAPPPPTLATDADDGARTSDLGRVLAFPAAVLVLGMLVFAATAFAGRTADLGSIGLIVRALAAVVVVGSVIELLGLRQSLDSWSTVFDDSSGRAVLARSLGGVAIAVGLGSLMPRIRRSLSAAVVAPERAVDELDTRWRPAAANAAGLLGAAVILFSFAFDGHTVTEGPRVLHAAASVVHVAAASAWAGGVAALAVLAWRRHRAAVATAVTEMTVRFSVVAMAALAVAAIAGVAMALMIDNDVVGYLDTAWGRTLVVKLVFVATGAAIGAYNHFRVLPELRRAPEDPAVLTTARRTLAVEAAALVGAAVVSGLLVAASTI